MAKVAGAHIDFTANAAKMLSELEKSRKEILNLRRTVDRSANRVKYAFNKIRRAAQVVASAFIFTAGLRQLGRLVGAIEKAADRVALMEARFQQFARAGDSFTRVYNLSQELGVSMDTTAESMTRLLIATKSIGTAQSDIENMVKNIVILGRAGGTSAEELKGGMRQLSQGLASGRLQGEELRSVLENLPLVMIEIAEQMDQPLGKMRELAADGKITSAIIVDALKEIGIKMDDLPQTFGMQTERMRTEWDLFLAELGNAVESAGLLDALIGAVKFVRLEMMGSFLGVSTDELRSQRADLGYEQARLRKGLLAEGAIDPLTGQATFDLQPPKLTGKDVRSDTSRNTVLYKQIARLRTLKEEEMLINDEIERRIELEKLAEAQAAARGISQDAAEDAKLLTRLQKRIDALRELLKSDWQKFQDQVDEINEGLAKGFLTQEESVQLIKHFYDELISKQADAARSHDVVLENMVDDTEKLDEAWKGLGLTFQSAFEDAIVEGENLRDVLTALLKDIQRIFLRETFTKQYGGQFSNWVSNLFTSGGITESAAGGPLGAGQMSLVGERGPELFVPSTSGMVIPNHALSSVGGANVTYNIDAKGTNEQLILATVAPLLERTVEATRSVIRQDRNEGRF